MSDTKVDQGGSGGSKSPLADRVTDWLREEILRHDLKPGERLAAESLAERFEVSPTPVREAFARLAGEGLVTALPQRGVRVSEISVSDVQDIYELRLLLEPLAIQRSIDSRTDEWAASVQAALERMNKAGQVELAALSPASYAAYEELHIAFHRSTMSACNSIWLLRFCGMLLDNTRRVRQFTVGLRTDFEDIAAEHQAIADACIEGDGTLAAQRHARHLQKTIDAFAAWDEQSQDPTG